MSDDTPETKNDDNDSAGAAPPTPITEPSPPPSDALGLDLEIGTTRRHEPKTVSSLDRIFAPVVDPAELERRSRLAEPPPASDGRRILLTKGGHTLTVHADPDELVGVELEGEGAALEVFTIVAGAKNLAWRGDVATAVHVDLGDGLHARLESSR